MLGSMLLPPVMLPMKRFQGTSTLWLLAVIDGMLYATGTMVQCWAWPASRGRAATSG